MIYDERMMKYVSEKLLQYSYNKIKTKKTISLNIKPVTITTFAGRYLVSVIILINDITVVLKPQDATDIMI